MWRNDLLSQHQCKPRVSNKETRKRNEDHGIRCVSDTQDFEEQMVLPKLNDDMHSIGDV